LQVIEKPEHTLAIPGRDFDFGQLLLAQAHGDADVLAQSSQPVVSITVNASAKERLVRALKS
jgi:glucose-6-phosphate isomerase